VDKSDEPTNVAQKTQKQLNPKWITVGLLSLGLLAFADPFPIFAVYGMFLWVVPLMTVIGTYSRKQTVGLDKRAASEPENTNMQSNIIRSRYWLMMFQLSSFWVGCCLLIGYSIFFLRWAMPNQWLIFTRSFTIGKDHPFAIWVIFDFTLLISGFFVVSGLIWLPMFIFFEGLAVKRKIRLLASGQPAHA
jgi:hypothetical protein